MTEFGKNTQGGRINWKTNQIWSLEKLNMWKMTDASICPRTPADKTSHTSADKPFPSLLTLLLRSRTKLLILTSRGHPRTPADLLHLPPICLALSGGSPFGPAKPCSSTICPELCIVRQRRQASKKLLGRHCLFFNLSHRCHSHMQVISHSDHKPKKTKKTCTTYKTFRKTMFLKKAK